MSHQVKGDELQGDEVQGDEVREGPVGDDNRSTNEENLDPAPAVQQIAARKTWIETAAAAGVLTMVQAGGSNVVIENEDNSNHERGGGKKKTPKEYRSQPPKLKKASISSFSLTDFCVDLPMTGKRVHSWPSQSLYFEDNFISSRPNFENIFIFICNLILEVTWRILPMPS